MSATHLRASRRGIRPWWGASICVALALGCYYLSTNEVLKKSAQAEEAEAAYRRAGFAWTAQEVRPDLPIAANEDAWTILKDVAVRIDPVKFEKLDRQIRGELDKRSSANYLEWWQPYSEIARLCSIAANRPKLSLGHDYDFGTELEYREAPVFKALEGCLCLRAAIQARQGMDSDAIGSLDTAWKLTNLLDQEPLPFDRLVEIHCRELVLRQVEECATVYRHKPNQLRHLRAVLDNQAPMSFVDTLRGQAYLSLAFVRNLEVTAATGTGSGRRLDDARLVRSGLPKNKEQRAMATRLMQEWVRLKPLMDADRNDPIRLGSDTDATAGSRKQRNGGGNILGFDYLGPDVIAMLKCEAETVAVKALLEGLASAKDDANLPNSIHQIPGKWIDPFTGEALLLKRGDHSLVISSLGASSKTCAGLMQGVSSKGMRNAFIGASYPPLR